MDVRFSDFPATRVAYRRKIGPYGAQVGAFVGDVFMPWMRANGLEGQPWYGVAHDDPSIAPAGKCRFDACVAVPDDFVPNGQALLTTLPGGRYAVSDFVGTALAIGDAWTEMFRHWLPGSGMQCDARPVYEYYSRDSRFDPATGVFNCELCIPVRPL
ncbi:MAG TPA: DNA gyrase inhibitor [Janthinobacterium sp.]|nr:DNA gyrase inhibitor [Janthinobacterium sp.]